MNKIKNPRLVFLCGGAATIYWPPGKLKDGGTCEFATKKCLAYCPELLEKNEAQMTAYDFMIDNTILVITNKIKREMDALGAKIIYWFGSGDCPTKDTDKVFAIMERLHKVGIPQIGYTRNRVLWEKTLGINNFRIALTIENKKEMEGAPIGSFFSKPNYKEGRVELILKKRPIKQVMGSCGWSFVETEKVISESQCSFCYENAVGCFRDW